MARSSLNIEELIECVKAHPILYNKSGKATEKTLVWSKLGKTLNQNPQVLKSKWRNIRDIYLRAMKNRKNYEDMNKLDLYVEYKHEAKLNEFLYEKTMAEITGAGSRKRKLNEESNSIPIYPNFKTVKTKSGETAILYRVAEDPNDNEEYLDEESEFGDAPSEIEKPSMSISENHQQKVEETNERELITEKQPQFPQKTTTTKSDIDVWLESIKSSFQNLTKINQAKAKRDINNLLSNYEIEQLTNE